MLINLDIDIEVIRVYARLNSIFSDISRGNENKNTILSIIEKVVYNSSENIYILNRINRFDNDINYIII